MSCEDEGSCSPGSLLPALAANARKARRARELATQSGTTCANLAGRTSLVLSFSKQGVCECLRVSANAIRCCSPAYRRLQHAANHCAAETLKLHQAQPRPGASHHPPRTQHPWWSLAPLQPDHTTPLGNRCHRHPPRLAQFDPPMR